MIKRLSLLALGLAITLPSAFASPILQLSLQESGLAALTASSGTGLVSITNTAYDAFVLNTVTGTGTPIYPSPELNLQTLNITSQNLATAKTLTVMVTETGLSGLANPLSYLSNFTGILNGVSSETISSYVDTTNAAFGMQQMLATSTFTASGANSYNIISSANTSGLFSESLVIVANFAPSASGDSLNSSALINTAVPEPASLTLFGGGLLGLALLRRRSVKKTS